MSKASMLRIYAAIFSFLIVGACTSAPMPTTWTRGDGSAINPTQLEADKAICRGKMEEANLVINARGAMPIYLPGQESPSLKVYTGCMAEHGYAAAK
jgi:hypothetical protein